MIKRKWVELSPTGLMVKLQLLPDIRDVFLSYT